MKTSISILIIIFGFAIFAPLLTPYPVSGDTSPKMGEQLSNRHLAPSIKHPFGTDELGRDIFARTLYGARISLGVGLAARILAVIIGGLIGSIAGFYGGKTDFILSRLIEIFLAFPSLILAIGIGTALGSGLLTVIIAIVAVSWVDVAVLIRAVSAEISKRDFVMAARAIGEPESMILFKHVIPHCYAPLIVTFSFGIASAVMIEASLSFLGLGSSGNSVLGPSWGWMIYTAEAYLGVAPWAVFGPGLFLAMTVFGWNMLGDSLRDKFDVKAELR
ncbi:MAG: ABC transporter permease [Candidatus Hydrogenedentes bacterium CG07_land_8_20_14_0_80_42_17]|nr:MAG: ABC transporter permease [Candidatus Hydrogenedentes bacterium CG07_land_8_20_14_0_80_42_17]